MIALEFGSAAASETFEFRYWCISRYLRFAHRRCETRMVVYDVGMKQQRDMRRLRRSELQQRTRSARLYDYSLHRGPSPMGADQGPDAINDGRQSDSPEQGEASMIPHDASSRLKPHSRLALQ